MKLHYIAAAILLSASAGCAAAENDDIYIEFLWSKTPVGAIARQETLLFVTESGHDSQICVAANATASNVGGLRIEFLDANGARVSLEERPDYDGIKHCYPADLGRNGAPGVWTAKVKLGDGRENSKTIRVDPSVQNSSYYLERNTPYVVGRPNYDASIPPEQWKGRLVWAMDVDPQGTVTHVDVEVAEGVGEKLRDRAIAAGYLSLFPPDPSRASKPLRWRRELNFAPD